MPAPTTPASPPQSGNAPSRGTVLIADDDPEILTMLSIRLSKKGYKVLEAADGLQTLQMARSQRPELRAAHANLLAQVQAVRIARSTYYPQIGLSGLLQFSNNPYNPLIGARVALHVVVVPGYASY